MARHQYASELRKEKFIVTLPSVTFRAMDFHGRSTPRRPPRFMIVLNPSQWNLPVAAWNPCPCALNRNISCSRGSFSGTAAWAVSRILCKHFRWLMFRTGYTGCTRAEGKALRRRNLSAGSAAGIRRGRAKLDPASKPILAVKRKISGVWGQNPQFKKAPFLLIYSGGAESASRRNQARPVAARIRSPHSSSN